jgi:hypothetical protein
MKVTCFHFLSQSAVWVRSGKTHENLSKRLTKRAAIELWKAQVHLSRIRAQLKIPKSTLRRILAFAKVNPLDPISSRKPGSGKERKISMETKKLMKEKLAENPSLRASRLRGCIPAFEKVSIQTIQDCCLKDLHLPSRKGQKAYPHAADDGAEAGVLPRPMSIEAWMTGRMSCSRMGATLS